MNLRQFDLNLLQSLYFLLETKSVSRAAENMGMSQPAMSGCLNRLRRAFKDDLLVRNGRRMVRTEAAAALRTKVRDVIYNIGDLMDSAIPFEAADARFELTVCCSDHAVAKFGAKLMARFHREAPRATLRWHHLQLGVDEELANGSIDFAVLPSAYEGHLPRVPLYEDTWTALACVNNTAVSDTPLTLKLLRQLHHIVVLPPGGRGPNTDSIAQARGISRTYAGLVENFHQATLLLPGTPFIAFVPDGAIRGLNDSIRKVPLDFNLPPMRMDLVWNGRFSVSPRHQWSRNLIVETAQEIATASAARPAD